MEWFSVDWWAALLGIIVIDLLLAGDNAIVIGLAARNVPKEQQRTVIALGTIGAIVIRIAATVAVVWLLKVPGLLIAGGLLLVWIAYKLLSEEKKHDVAAKHTLWAAVRTIVIADGIMGLDNVLAVAGAAHGDFELVIIGLVASVPIVVWGSTLFLKLIDRFPAVLYIGAGVLAFTAAKMITGEPLLDSVFDSVWLKWAITAAVVAGVLGAGRYRQVRRRRSPTAA
ncbi:membrane protein [Gordoniibacillus kamchatkensis]|uniref:Membrane protein n=1 Tax=Gordoniibacillus kamchatkensis TaxID=1590651 RepID=A0ABR5AFR9_9BACL|nr:TerC family protein [Paenibacillus sp. VKM B-2647]KIL39901.1 membrane protein [Paenibacillus sp. VKM B-2647]